ncbi:MAG: hypothetical protein K6B65_06970 [Bacilli bacterium]|nr:hypothetical protein [Bacilli bacterium]
MKKSFAFGMLLASGLLVACGGSSTSSASSSEAATSVASTTSEVVTSVDSKATIAYEITASYEELYDMFGAFEFYGLMYSDNTGVLYKALVQSGGDNKNLPQVEEEPTSFKYKVTDDDGIETLEASIGGTKFTGYKNSDGAFVLQSYSFPFAGGYTRSVDLVISKTIVHGSEEAWENAMVKKYKDRTITVTVAETYKGSVYYADGDNKGQAWMVNFGSYGTFPGEAKFELNSDFSVAITYGVGGSNGGGSYTGSWTVGSDNLHTITIGEKSILGVKDGEHETFTWTWAHQAKDADGNAVGDPINLTATLSWVDPTAEA